MLNLENPSFLDRLYSPPLFSAVFINLSFKAVPAVPALLTVWSTDVVQSS